MPHPKNRLKLTGDTHLPDLRDFMEQDDDETTIVVPEAGIEAEPRVYADGWNPSAASDVPRRQPQQPQGAVQQLERKVEQLPARAPWMAIGAGLLFGWLVARMLRH